MDRSFKTTSQQCIKLSPCLCTLALVWVFWKSSEFHSWTELIHSFLSLQSCFFSLSLGESLFNEMNSSRTGLVFGEEQEEETHCREEPFKARIATKQNRKLNPESPKNNNKQASKQRKIQPQKQKPMKWNPKTHHSEWNQRSKNTHRRSIEAYKRGARAWRHRSSSFPPPSCWWNHRAWRHGQKHWESGKSDEGNQRRFWDENPRWI